VTVIGQKQTLKSATKLGPIHHSARHGIVKLQIRILNMRSSKPLGARFLKIFATVVGTGLGCISMSEESLLGSCSPELYRQAESLLADASAGWVSLQKHQRAFGSCDDGALAEGYSEAVVHLLAQQWGQFSIFASFAKKNTDFKHWAVHHIDESTSDKDLNRIVTNAETCTDDGSTGQLCQIIGHAAEDALRELAKTK
jgi:hypothetical protein